MPDQTDQTATAIRQLAATHPDLIAAIDATAETAPDSFRTHLATTERDRAEAEAAANAGERDDALDERDALLRTNQQLAARLRHADAEHGDALADLTAVWTALNTAGMTGPSSAAELVTRLAAERDDARREYRAARAELDTNDHAWRTENNRLRDTIATLRQIDRDATQLRADLDAGRVADRLGDPPPGGFHVTRGTGPGDLEAGCPCAKAACGAVDTERTDPACDQHPPSHGRTMRQMHRADQCPAASVPPARAQESIRPADWEQHATDAIQATLADTQATVGTLDIPLPRLAAIAVEAIVDAWLVGPGGRCRRCGDTYPRTLPAGQDPLCWTCDSEEQTGPFEQAEG